MHMSVPNTVKYRIACFVFLTAILNKFPHNISFTVCKNIIDIAVITDASTSVTSRNYVKVKEFIVKLTEEFNVGRDKTHFAMIHFSWKSYLDFNFSDREFWDAGNLRTKIMSSRYIYGEFHLCNFIRVLKAPDQVKYRKSSNKRPLLFNASL